MRIPAVYQRRKARIEIIPLIDIIFFLLATFMMVSMSMVKNLGVPVQLPASATAVTQDRKLSVTITFIQDGTLYLDKEIVLLENLREKLRQLKESTPDIAVFINGDERADFGKAIEILDEIRILGITKVSVQTKSK